jgi:hypothetical protein
MAEDVRTMFEHELEDLGTVIIGQSLKNQLQASRIVVDIHARAQPVFSSRIRFGYLSGLKFASVISRRALGGKSGLYGGLHG